jgi:hypothetical protein
LEKVEKVKTSVSIDKDVLEFIQKLADNERTNVSHIINREFLVKMREGK